MVRTTNESGFAGVAFLAAIVVIVAVGGAAWLVYSRQNHSKPVSSVTDTTPVTKVSQSSPGAEATASGFLKINEWGVMVPIPQAYVGDFAYQLSEAQDQAELYFKDESALLKYCGPGSEGSLKRFDASSDSASISSDTHLGSVKVATINGFNYYFYHSTAACYDPSNPDDQAKEKQAFADKPEFDLNGAINQLQMIQ